MRGLKLKPTHILKLFILGLVWEVIYAQKVQVKVGLVVNDTASMDGKKAIATVSMALSDFYAAHSWFKTRLLLHPRSSLGDIVNSASVVVDLIKNEQVAAIIGPETSMEANFDINLGDKARVPIITYSATSPFLYSLGSDYFIQATQVDVAQLQALTSIIKAYGWRQVVPIYVDNEFGGGLIPTFLVDALEQIGTRIPYRCTIASSATKDQIVAELNNLKSMPTRVFIVHMDIGLGVQLFSAAMKLDMMSSDYVWIITNGIGNLLDLLTPNEIQSMQGVIGVRTYIPRTKDLDSFVIRWKTKMMQENPNVVDPVQVTVFELWAYDAITALARAVEQVVGTRFSFAKTNASSLSPDLSTLGVSRAGEKLALAIRGTRFVGLSGNFILVDGQLQSSILEIVNIVGKGERMVGVWTPQNGFLREMNVNDSVYSISKERLRPIIWPGDRTNTPKGWATPTNGKKLRVLVPIKDGFEQFVNVKHNPGSGTQITGFCVDIFDEVMKSLPYPVPYEYVHFDKPDGASTASYDDLISEVYYQRYDAIMGDVSILANRSTFVDFTFPYTESGVIMVAPIEDKNERMSWVFFKPLSLELWLVSIFSFLVFAIAIWFLERHHPDFRGIDNSLFFSFATVVFAHGAPVGYQIGSFVEGFLKDKGIKNLKPYKSVEELRGLLSNGGIAAAFDEIPYIKVFLASSDNCDKYMIVPPSYSNDGLAFAFQLGSPLVSDVSRQVLKVREGNQMVAIEEKWFGTRPSCPESTSAASVIPSSSLDLYSYRQLFVIMLVITVVIVVASILMSRWSIVLEGLRQVAIMGPQVIPAVPGDPARGQQDVAPMQIE